MTAPRRRWSFSLRTLFVVVTVLAVIWWACASWPVQDGFFIAHTLRGEPSVPERIYRPPTATEAFFRASAWTVGAMMAWSVVALAKHCRAKAAPGDSPANQADPL
jgi:hypothetical protein